MEVNVKELPELLRRALKAQLVPMIHGSPGCGKSDIARQVADKYQLKVIDLRLSQCEPVDLSGFPFVNNKSGKCNYLPMDTFPLETDPIPDGFNGWLLLLDELPSAPPSTQASAYKLILDRMVGLHKLHPQVSIIATGNLATDRAVVYEMGTALQSRMLHFEVSVNNDTWLKWAVDNAIDHRILSYIRFRPDFLHKFDPNHNDKTFPCPRTWHFVSKLIKDIPDTHLNDHLHTALVASAIGEGTAREFVNYCDIYDKIPTYQEILRNPETVTYSAEPSVLYALTGLIAHNAEKADLDEIIKFVRRLPVEFCVIAFRGIIAKCPTAINHPYIDKWLEENTDILTVK